VWSVSFSPSGKAELRGTIKVQVHYYEDGNVQLVSCKEIKEPLVITVSLFAIAINCNYNVA
jgi:capping protein (actin filament) muscle Z-line, alpha